MYHHCDTTQNKIEAQKKDISYLTGYQSKQDEVHNTQ
jgi:hypothetical protein